MLQLTAAGRRRLVRSLPLWEEAQRQFLSQFGTESLQELRALLTSAESAVTKAFTADQEKPQPARLRTRKGDLLMPDYGLKTFISSWHNTVRHTLACSSLNVTSPLILEAPFGKGPCQAAIIRHPTVCTDRTHKVGAQSLPWPPSFATLWVKTILIQKV